MVGMDDSKPLWDWGPAPGHDPVKPARPRGHPPQDTPKGCNEMAAADMARAAGQQEGWARTRFEHSAVMWSRRAKLLKYAEAGPEAA